MNISSKNIIEELIEQKNLCLEYTGAANQRTESLEGEKDILAKDFNTNNRTAIESINSNSRNPVYSGQS